jgi:lathosterol oxidase
VVLHVIEYKSGLICRKKSTDIVYESQKIYLPSDSTVGSSNMDLVLDIANDLVLDKFWAHTVPLSAFADFATLLAPVNSTAKSLVQSSSLPSTWSQLISHLPHPPLSSDELASLYSNAQSPVLLSAWPRDYIPRQVLSIAMLMLLGIHVLYFLFAGLSYRYIFNHEMMRHPKFLDNQVRLEIQTSLRAFPVIALLTIPWFQAEVMGYSKLYDRVDTYGYAYLFASVPL